MAAERYNQKQKWWPTRAYILGRETAKACGKKSMSSSKNNIPAECPEREKWLHCIGIMVFMGERQDELGRLSFQNPILVFSWQSSS